MTIVVFSDSHGSDFEMAEVLRRQKRHADCFLHLGDGAVTFLELCDELGVLGYAVKGNCDHFLKGRDIPTSRMLTFEGISLFLAHGDAYGVGLSRPYDIYVWDGVGQRWVNNGQLEGQPGADGADGATFTPSVASDGTLSWTNDGGLENPAPVNIKGKESRPARGV